MATDTRYGGTAWKVNTVAGSDVEWKLLLVGETGVGKSTTGNFIFTGSSSTDGLFEKGRAVHQPFMTLDSIDHATQISLPVRARLLGDPSLPLGVVIDTPGLNDDRGPAQDQKNIESIVQTLEMQSSIKALGIVMRPEPRIPYPTLLLMACLSATMPGIKDNLIIIVPRWNYSDDSQKKRNKGKSITKAKFCANIREVMARTGASGMSLTKKQAAKVPVFFFDSNSDPGDGHYTQSYNDAKRLITTVSSMEKFCTLSLVAQRLNVDLQEVERLVAMERERAKQLESDLAAEKRKMSFGDCCLAFGRGMVGGLTLGVSEIPWTGTKGSSLGSVITKSLSGLQGY